MSVYALLHISYWCRAFFCETNAQGDIVGLLDSNNNEVVTYTYDSWGKLISIGGSLASTVGVENPLRYRGYYYDTETGLYYLQSRYYNPDWGRFISQDEAQYHEGMTGAAANLYAYGDNNPVMMSDPTGHISLWNRLCYIGQAAWDIKQAAWVLFTFSFRGNSLYEAGVGYIARIACGACYNIMAAQVGADFLAAEVVAQQYPEAIVTCAAIISCIIQVSSLIPNVFEDESQLSLFGK